MEGQREKLNGNRRRRRRSKSESKTQTAPILIAARRPDSPRMGKISRRNIAASARPKRNGSAAFIESGTETLEATSSDDEGNLLDAEGSLDGQQDPSSVSPSLRTDAARSDTTRSVEADKPRRVVRIAHAPTAAATPSILAEAEKRRERLLDRLVTCEGRGAISRIASELLDSGGVPEEQPYQLQLLEHVDERRASEALDALTRLFERQVPIKRPILEQRLRRLEEEAEEGSVRDRARELRRRLRAVTATNERI